MLTSNIEQYVELHKYISSQTRQSDMANTSPRHMPVLGNVHPTKIENFDIFAWRHFSARSSFYIINWYGYPRGSMKNIWKKLSVQFLRYPIQLLHVKRRTRHKWR